MSHDRGSERVGQTIREKYTIDRVLGVGGMAVVYVATHRNRKRFAVKMLHPELSQRRDIRDRFLREGYVANTVDHPGAVAVVDDDVAEDGSAFLVMELLEGVEVEALWERNARALPLDVTLAIADGLLDVLVSAHAKGIVHRDLKPANLFVTKLGQVKVLDFGIARLRENESQAQTQTGAMMGTPAFLPPEQAAGRTKEIDGQTDLWAVGATVFSLLSGQFVHPAENGAQMVIMSATQPARSLRTVTANTPPWVTAWVDRALALAKHERWANAQTMQAELRRQAGSIFAVKAPQQALADALGFRPSAAVASQSPFAETVLPDATPAPPSAPIGGPAHGLGGTTAPPVSADPPPRLPGATTQSSKKVGWIALVGLVAVVGALGSIAATILYVGQHDLKPDPAPAQAATSAATATVSADPSASVAPPTSIASLIPRPTAAVTVKPHPSASTTTTTATATQILTAPRPNCDPPYTVDSKGDHHFKPECF